MGRKARRVPVYLDTGGISDLPFEEIKAILRGADDLIMRGGRSLLAKVLKGSKEKRVHELNLDKSPVYGYFKNLTIEEITAKIDWVIENGYLRIEYDYRLPLLVYTGRGWEIEMDTYTDELFEEFTRIVERGQIDNDMSYLKDKDRKMVLMLLDKVQERGDIRYIPLLKNWEKVDYKKIQKRIGSVIKGIKSKQLRVQN